MSIAAHSLLLLLLWYRLAVSPSYAHSYSTMCNLHHNLSQCVDKPKRLAFSIDDVKLFVSGNQLCAMSFA